MNYVDPDGKVTQLVFGRHTENNVFGHVAIAIMVQFSPMAPPMSGKRVTGASP